MDLNCYNNRIAERNSIQRTGRASSVIASRMSTALSIEDVPIARMG